nr:MAG TPA: tail protein [Caudoviricetes sp.]
MTPTYDRKVLVDNVALNSASFFVVDQVRLDQIAEKEITTTKRANTHGEYTLGAAYGSKPVYLSGHFEAPQRWDYEVGRDQLMAMLNASRTAIITVEQSGELRRFEGMYERARFDYKERGFVMVDIEFKITSSYGESVATSKPVDGFVYTDVFDKRFFVDGSTNTSPIITCAFEAIQPVSKAIKIGFIIQSNGIRQRIDIERLWGQSDTLVIDAKRQEIRVNGAMVQYSGMLPTFFGDTQVMIVDESVSRRARITIEYNNRWL